MTAGSRRGGGAAPPQHSANTLALPANHRSSRNSLSSGSRNLTSQGPLTLSQVTLDFLL